MGARASVGGQLPNAAYARMVRGEEDNERGDIERKRGLTLRVSFASPLIGRRPDQLGPMSQVTLGIVRPST